MLLLGRTAGRASKHPALCRLRGTGEETMTFDLTYDLRSGDPDSRTATARNDAQGAWLSRRDHPMLVVHLGE